ncbi:MAG: copper homeostasis protein CutC [Pirellula sp.]
MLEVCVESLQGARIAVEAGAQRIELSERLSVGGVSPSIELIRSLRREMSESLIVLIRCRAGDFVYSPTELEAMLEQARQAIASGADGLAVGACKPDRSLDWHFLTQLQRVVRSESEAAWLVVHRVFDRVPDPLESIERLIELGYDRILTSGPSDRAIESLESLGQWQSASRGRLEILPASGIHSGNALTILQSTLCEQLHGSFTRTPTGSASSLPIAEEVAEVRRLIDEHLERLKVEG